MRTLLLPFLLCACSAGHLGNPLTLPARGLLNAAENASYNAQRAEVKAHLTTHAPAIRAALPTCAPTPATCPHLAPLLNDIPTTDHARVTTELRDITQPDWAESATVIVMVHRR